MSVIKNILRYLKPYIERFPRLAIFYRTIRDHLHWNELPVPTPWDFDLVGNKIMASGKFEPTETIIVRNLLGEVDMLINVGANIGYYCSHALSLHKSVIAFEPIHRNLTYLCKNIKINNWVDVEIFPIALSSNVGIIEIYGSGTGASLVKGWAGGSEIYKTLVPCSTLDLNIAHRISGKKSLILVDIEGAESLMLEGAIQVLNSLPRPIWFMEIMIADHQPEGIKTNPNFQNIFELFNRHGYKAFAADLENREILLSEIPDILSQKISLGIHNFIGVIWSLEKEPERY